MVKKKIFLIGNKNYFDKKFVNEKIAIIHNPNIKLNIKNIKKIKKEKLKVIIACKDENYEYIKNDFSILKKNKIQTFFYKKINQRPSTSQKLLKKYVKTYDVISFDLFDTLIKRKCSKPQDIFNLIFFLKNKKQNKTFLSDRVNWDNKNNESLLNINSIYKKKKYNISKNDEFNTDLKLITLNKNLIEIYNYARKKKKKIILTTDIHYDKIQINKIINKLNLKFEKKYISSELKKSKINSQIFAQILEDFKNLKILHIGDNYLSDYVVPRKLNIKSIYLPNKKEILKKTKIITFNKFNKNLDKIVFGILQNEFSDIFYKRKKLVIENLYDLGYLIYGPVILYYLIWINNSLDKKNLLLFSLRDGYITKKLYDRFFSKKNTLTEYIHVSRRAVIPATFFNFKDILNSFSRHRFRGKIKELFLKRFNLNFKNYKDQKIISTLVPRDFKYLKNYLKPYKNYILNQAKKQRENFLLYLKKKLKTKKSIFIVDPGYFGSAQIAIEKISEFRMRGLYWMGYPYKNHLSSLNYKNKDHLNLWYIFEPFFTSPYGSTINYTKKGEPILGKKYKNQKLFYKKLDFYKGLENFISDIDNIINLKNISKNDYTNDLGADIFKAVDLGDIKISKKLERFFNLDNDYVRKGDKKIIFSRNRRK